MRTSPLLADFIHHRVCKPICEKLLTLPLGVSLNKRFGRYYPAKNAKHVHVCIACYNMLDPKSSMLKNVLFSGSYQSYNERVIGLSKHCLSYPRSIVQTVSRPFHCSVRLMQVELSE